MKALEQQVCDVKVSFALYAYSTNVPNSVMYLIEEELWMALDEVMTRLTDFACQVLSVKKKADNCTIRDVLELLPDYWYHDVIDPDDDVDIGDDEFPILDGLAWIIYDLITPIEELAKYSQVEDNELTRYYSELANSSLLDVQLDDGEVIPIFATLILNRTTRGG